MTELEKMLNGMLYQANDKELSLMRSKASELTYEYNLLKPNDKKRQQAILKELLGSMGEDVTINRPFLIDYGCHLFIGDHFFANYNFTVLDVAKISIGNNVMLATNVSILTASHPIDKVIRRDLHEYGKEVIIKDDVWIGSNVVINPGVTIGNGVVIGSGSVVTKDLDDDYLCYGNPCKMIRKIGEADRLIWQKEKELSLNKPK